MTSRMDKYNSDSVKNIKSRSEKNEYLYKQLYNNKVYTEFTDIVNDNVVDLDGFKQTRDSGLRENYQKQKLINPDYEPIKYQNSYDESINQSNLETKSYDINDVLENARKNRSSDDEMQQKRYLKTVEYSILSDLSKEKLKEAKDKKQKLTKEEENNLEELINTITSNSLRKKIDDELLSDLLPTEDSETIISKQLLDELENTKDSTDLLDSSNDNNKDIEDSDSDDDDENQIDKSFYTKSMDLSEEDFEQDEEDKSFIDSSNSSNVKKIVTVVLVLLIIALIAYVIYRFI